MGAFTGVPRTSRCSPRTAYPLGSVVVDQGHDDLAGHVLTRVLVESVHEFGLTLADQDLLVLLLQRDGQYLHDQFGAVQVHVGVGPQQVCTQVQTVTHLSTLSD